MQKIKYDDECPDCGASIVITTKCNEKNKGYDGDALECQECQWRGYLIVDEDGNAEIND